MAVLYSVALFVSAALLFLVQPLVGKQLLPLLGSSPQVWNTTVLFFQAALLAGYAFSHFTTTRLSARKQAVVQVVLLAAAAIALPAAIPADADAPATANPIPWLLGTLAVTVGLPFFALAANGPMLQRWLAATRHRTARDPYFLFAASNGGSLLGLLAYPLVLEPQLALGGQSDVWSAGYVVGVVFVLACAVALVLRPGREDGEAGEDGEAAAEPAPEPEPEPAREIGTRDRLRWLALAAVPSSLMLGTTTYITRDLTPVPLLWVIPLALYLITFIVAFAPGVRAERIVRVLRIALPVVAIIVVYTLAVGAQSPIWLILPLHLVGLVAAALMCHARLAADRPPARQLTEFYLWLSAGGALGGIVNAIVAPLVLPGLIEYPLAIVAACLLIPKGAKKRPDLLEFFLRDPRPTKAMDYIAPVLVGLVATVALLVTRPDETGDDVSTAARAAILGVFCGLVVNFARRPLRFGLALAAVLIAATIVSEERAQDVLERERSFFGIYKVVSAENDRYHELYDGTTLHGLQQTGAGRREPLEYYNRSGPVGQAMDNLPPATTARMGVIGLGSGAMACYRPQTRFYEIDPTVADIARDPRLFTFLRDCPASVVIGDGRKSLERERPGRFGLLAVDAFNSDAIPVHLITREAIDLYLDRVARGGVVLFHISNRYVELEPVLGNISRELGITCRAQRHVPPAAERARGYGTSNWAVLSRARADLGAVATDMRWQDCGGDGSRAWSDDYSDLIGAMSFG